MASKPEIIFRGSGVSSGVVWGQALKLDIHNRLIIKVAVDDVEAEVRRFLKAIEISKDQVQSLKARLEEKVGEEHGVILDTHFLILDDRMLHAEILDSIRSNHANTEWALIQATDRLVRAYKSLEDEYFRERHSDIEHVVERILLNLSGDSPFSLANLPEDVIIVSRDFNPSNFATMDHKNPRPGHGIGRENVPCRHPEPWIADSGRYGHPGHPGIGRYRRQPDAGWIPST
jgi:phosphotransferase system enzyme I (PtsI)